VFSAFSVPRVYNTSPPAAKKNREEYSVEFRGSRVTEQEIAIRLDSDLKCSFSVEIRGKQTTSEDEES
jgi:hypothetical protein